MNFHQRLLVDNPDPKELQMTINAKHFARLILMAQDLEAKKTGHLPNVGDLFLRILGENAAEQLLLLIGEFMSRDPEKAPPKLFKTADGYFLEVIEPSEGDPMGEWFRYQITLDGTFKGSTAEAWDAECFEANRIHRVVEQQGALARARAETETIKRLHAKA